MRLLPAATPGTIISPVAVTINEGGPGFFDINNTRNQAGLFTGFVSGTTKFDSYIASRPLHTPFSMENEWFSNLGTTGAVVTYDLGAATTIDRLALWNEEVDGIGTLDLQVSTDGTTFKALVSGLHPTNNPNNLEPYPADVFSFAPTLARYVRFVISDSPQPDNEGVLTSGIGEVAFRVAAAADIAGVSAKWNSVLGGFDFKYTVEGKLKDNATAKVYWAQGTGDPTYADRLSDTPVFTWTIKAGDRGKKPKTETAHVNGSLLKDAPPGTTRLIVVFDPDDALGESKEDNNVTALNDVEITWGGNPPALQNLSDKTIGIIKDALRYAGEDSAEINSTYRTPGEQADEMLTVIRSQGFVSASLLYSGANGQQVLAIYSDAKSAYDKALKAYQAALRKYNRKPEGPPPVAPTAPDYRALMAAKVQEIVDANPDTAFAHTRDFRRWNTADIRFASVKNKLLFHQALNGDARKSKLLDPFNSTDKAFHIEVRL